MMKQAKRRRLRADVDTSIKLGQSTCLLSGYQADVYDIHFQPSPKPALLEVPIEIENPDLDERWTYPIITLHKNREDLISELYQIKLRRISFEDDPSEGGAVAKWPSGALTLKGLTDEALTQAVQELSSQIGVDLSVSERSYALVRRTRTVGTATHKSFQRGVFGNPDPGNTLMPETLASIKKLAKQEKQSVAIDVDGARGYLEYIETYGSHYVSSVNVGDSLFQVFAYNKTEFDNLVKLYEDPQNHMDGPGSVAFVTFTTPKNELGYGYTAAVGTIGITSCDPELDNTIANGLWHDENYTQTNSIFAPYIRSDSVNANEVFKKITVISTELTSLEVYAEYYRKKIWRRVFKGAMYAKYAEGSGVAPYFSNNCPFNLDEVFKDSDDPLAGDSLLSTLATPTVSMWQELTQYNDIQLQFPEMVERFSIFANAIQITPAAKSSESDDTEDVATTFDVPGGTTATFLSYIISVGGTEPCAVPPNLKLSDAAYKEFKAERLSCGDFFGGLRVCNTGESSDDNESGSDESFVVMNGLMFEYKEGKVCVVKDVRDAPPSSISEERITDIQFGLTAAEARLNYVLQSSNTDQTGLRVMQGFLLWLARILNTAGQSQELCALQARAKYLAKVTANPNNAGVPIPYLKYEAYTDVVNNVQRVLETASAQLTDYQNQIRARKAEEREIDRQDQINQNIINSGKLLEAYIRTQAEYQKDIANMFTEVIDQKKVELDEAMAAVDELTTKLDDQRGVVEDSIDAYKQAVIDWRNREMIKAVINIAANIFTVGFAFVTPSGSITALADLGKTVQKIQKAVLILDSVIKTYNSYSKFPDDPQQVIDALDAAGLNGMELPTTLEWDEMKVQFDATLACGPPVSEKDQLNAAFSVLVLRGKALIQCQDNVQQICADLSAAQQQLYLAQKQEERLDELKVDLSAKPEDLDVANIDLIGLSGQLVFFQRQMLMTLSNTIVIQDRALQYEYLRPPTPIGSFTLLNLQLTILRQSQSINTGLTVQPKPGRVEFPIIYEVHGLRPESITNNNRFTFDIDLNKREFLSYNYVRVESVAVEIGGIASTNSGKYYAELYFDGEPFYDRGFDREKLTFQTSSRYYTSLQDVNASDYEFKQAKLKDFDAKVSQITPFSRWHIGLPNSPTNEGITFKDDPRGVTVRLVFHIYAQLKESTTCLHANNAENWTKALQLLQREPRREQREAKKLKIQQQTRSTTGRKQTTRNRPLPAAHYVSPIRAMAAANPKSTAEVLELMSGKSVCSGWDAVFSMTAEEVNEQLRLQYEDRQGNPNFLREIHQEYREMSSEGVLKIQKLDFVLDVPEMQFLLNNKDYCRVFMTILSGTYKYAMEVDGTEIPIDNIDIKESDGSYIQGDVALATMEGSVSSTQDVTINLHDGAFSPQNFVTGIDNATVKAALEDYFMNLEDGYELYKLGTLDLSNYTGLQSLVPTSFKFNVLHTPSDRDLLQLFIATTGQPNDTLHLYMSAEEPVPAEYQSSLIVNSSIFFQEVLPAAVGDGGVGLVLSSSEPPDNEAGDKMWSCVSTAGMVNVPFPDTRLTHEYQHGDGFSNEIESWIRMPPDGKIPISLANMNFRNDEFGQLHMNYESNEVYNFEYGTRFKQTTIFGTSDWSKIGYKPYQLQVKIVMNSVMPLNITGEGQDQSVLIGFDESAVKCDGNIEPPGGMCEATDHDLQVLFFGKFEEYVPGALQNIFRQQFQSVSLFALKNILFPGKNLINMIQGYVPGDMVVFGKFSGE